MFVYNNYSAASSVIQNMYFAPYNDEETLNPLKKKKTAAEMDDIHNLVDNPSNGKMDIVSISNVIIYSYFCFRYTN